MNLHLRNVPSACYSYEVIYTPTDIYMVMEFVPGGELFDFIVSNGRVRSKLLFTTCASGQLPIACCLPPMLIKATSHSHHSCPLLRLAFLWRWTRLTCTLRRIQF